MYCRLSFLIDFLTALIFCLYSSFRWISFCSLSSFPLICRLDSTSARELIQGLFSCFMRPSTVLLVSSFLKCLPNFVYILITFLHCLIVSKRFLGSSLNSSRLLLFESFFVLNFILADFLLAFFLVWAEFFQAEADLLRHPRPWGLWHPINSCLILLFMQIWSIWFFFRVMSRWFMNCFVWEQCTSYDQIILLAEPACKWSCLYTLRSKFPPGSCRRQRPKSQ